MSNQDEGRFLHFQRTRRLRRLAGLRDLVRETHLSAKDFILPLFVRYGSGEKREIVSMPGVYQWSVDRVNEVVDDAAELGIPAVILFGIPEHKDAIGTENFAPDGVVQRAIHAIKEDHPDMVVVTDVCLCEYTDHGHCGVLNTGDPLPNPYLPEGHVLNDPTLSILGKVARSHAEAGADVIAPSGMMDGMVLTIRNSLDEAGFEHIPILSYAVKYASSFYGPFRDAAESPPKFGDRRSHQMDPANRFEALREAQIDLDEGADMLMVKPALPYMDVLRTVKDAYPEISLGAYNVSGEYAMIKAAAKNGWIDGRGTILELLTGLKRAGADFILTYHAAEAAAWIKEG